MLTCKNWASVQRAAPDLALVIGLLKERANTTVELAQAATLFYREPQADPALRRSTLLMRFNLPARVHRWHRRSRVEQSSDLCLDEICVGQSMV